MGKLGVASSWLTKASMVSASSPTSTASTLKRSPSSARDRRSIDGISRRHGGHQVAQKLTSTTRPLSWARSWTAPSVPFSLSAGAGLGACSVRLWDSGGRSAARARVQGAPSATSMKSAAPAVRLRIVICTPHLLECSMMRFAVHAPDEVQVELPPARHAVGRHALVPVARLEGLHGGKLRPIERDARRFGHALLLPQALPFRLAADGARRLPRRDIAPVGQPVADRRVADVADHGHEDAFGSIAFRLGGGKPARLIKGARLVRADLRQPHLDALRLGLPA